MCFTFECSVFSSEKCQTLFCAFEEVLFICFIFFIVVFTLLECVLM